MIVKVSAYMEMDLLGMSTHELIEIKSKIEATLHGRQSTDNPTIMVALKNVRALNALEWLLKKGRHEITVNDVCNIKLKEFSDVPHVGKKAIEAVNDMLLMYGYHPLNNPQQ